MERGFDNFDSLWLREPVLLPPVWSPDGTRIVFSHGGFVYNIDSRGYTLRRFNGGRRISMSPDGSRIAYEVKSYIAASALDGSDRQRLTRESGRQTNPVWSPDGSHIAYVSDGLRTMVSDGSNIRVLMDPQLAKNQNIKGFTGVVRWSPVWSPDGQSIAFLGLEGDSTAVYTIGSDGANVRRLGETTNLTSYDSGDRYSDASIRPAWSPDGRRVAFLRGNWHSLLRLYTIGPDGSDPREILTFPKPDHGYDYIGTVSWSHDGSEILFRTSVIGLDGPTLKILPKKSRGHASWSPDGSKIAVLAEGPDPFLHIVDSDGSNGRILAMRDGNGKLSAARGRPLADGEPATIIYFDGSGPTPPPSDISECSNRVVVPNPGDNPFLVQDCETLLSIRDVLAGNPPLDWSTDTYIGEWKGVVLDSPSAGPSLVVDGLRLRNHSLIGAIPASLGHLTGLRNLDLSHNWLTGEMPAELGNLMHAKRLDLSNNRLTGEIPAELGNLMHAKRLDLSNNRLTGTIPPELGDLTELEMLNLSGNGLVGDIPMELGRLENLIDLYLHFNQLSNKQLQECARVVGGVLKPCR